MVAHTCNLGTQEVEAGGLQNQSHPQLHSEFKDSLGCLGPFKMTGASELRGRSRVTQHALVL